MLIKKLTYEHSCDRQSAEPTDLHTGEVPKFRKLVKRFAGKLVRGGAEPSFPFGGPAADFVEEVLQELHLVIGPLLSWPLSRDKRDESFAVRTNIQILHEAG